MPKHVAFVSLVHFRYRVSDSKDDAKNLKKSNISFASFDNLFSLPELQHSRLGSKNFFYIHYIIFFVFYKSFLNYFYLFRKNFMTSKSAKSNVKFLEVLQPQAGQSFDRHIVSAAAIKVYKSRSMEYI